MAKQSEVAQSVLPNTETPLGLGEQPWIASAADGFYTVWTRKRDGEMFLMKPNSTEPDRLGNKASFPIIVSIPSASNATAKSSSKV